MNKNQLNILFLASWYPNRVEPQDGNFVQRHAIATASYARVAALHVRSVADAKDFTVERRWYKNVLEVIVYFPKTLKILPFIKLQRYKKAHYLGYETILKEIGAIDLVHLNVQYPAGVFALALKKRFGIPFVITEHWTAFLKSNPHQFSFFQSRVIQQCGREASAICPVSNDLKNAIQTLGIHSHFEVIPNVVDTNLFTSRTVRKQGKPIQLLHVSTLFDPHKNVSGILRTVARLKEQRQDFSLTIVGNNYVAKHRSYAKELNIPDAMIRIQGETPYDEIAELMQSHDLFILFSHYENLPCVISEALVAGLPVLSSDVGGISEMISPENGVLIPANDEATLLKNLKEMMTHPEQYNRKAIRKAAVEKYSYEAVGRQYVDLYKKVLKAPNLTT